MRYNSRPIYKYIIIILLTSLLIFHQKTNLTPPEIISFSMLVAFFCVLMDYVFITDHPNILYEEKKRKRKRNKIDYEKLYKQKMLKEQLEREAMEEDMEEYIEEVDDDPRYDPRYTNDRYENDPNYNQHVAREHFNLPANEYPTGNYAMGSSQPHYWEYY